MPKQTATKPATPKKRTSRGVQIDFAPRKTAKKPAATPVKNTASRKTTASVSVRRAPKKAVSTQRAITPRKTVKTPQNASKVVKTAKSTSVKINFGPKKATVRKKTISVKAFDDEPPIVETRVETAEYPPEDCTSEYEQDMYGPEASEYPPENIAEELRGYSLDEVVAEPDLLPSEEPLSPETDLEEVFDELENGRNLENSELFDDYENPLDHAQKTFIAEPEPLELDHDIGGLDPLDSFAEAPIEDAPNAERRVSVQASAASVPHHRPNPPFLASVTVDKRPLSGGAPRTETSTPVRSGADGATVETAVETAPSSSKTEKTAKKKAAQPTTDIYAAPKKSSGLGLVAAILLTIIAGGLVGALIYFLFFPE